MGKFSDQDTADARNANPANDHKNGEWTAADIRAERERDAYNAETASAWHGDSYS
jgi:hypothetical protein